jgi:tetratricopeptide (TPR) repeat protein/TolB-like protein
MRPVLKRASHYAALFSLLLCAPLAAHAGEITVLVNAFENQTSDRNIDWIGEGLAVLIAERLSASRSLYVFTRDERMAAYDRIGIPGTAEVSRATAVKIGWDMGADIVVMGRIFGSPEDFHIEARILDLEKASSQPPITSDGKLDDVMSMASALAAKLEDLLVPGALPHESDYTLRPPTPRSAFEAYVRGLVTEDHQRSVELFKDAVRLHPQYASASYRLGRFHYFDMDYRGCVALLEKVPPGTTEYPYARFTLAVSYYRMGSYDAAAAILSDLPPIYDVLVNLGAALAATGDVAGAQSAWKRAGERDSSGSEAAFNLAYLALVTNEVEAARRALEQFLQLNGRDAEAYFALGRALERLGLAGESQRALAQAVRLSPRIERWAGQPMPNLTRLRGQFEPMEIRFPSATGIWSQSRLSRRAAGQDLAAWIESVRERIDSQPFSETIRELRDMARTFPESPDVPLLLGYVYERQGRYDLARSEYQLSLQLKASVEGYLTLARLHRAQNQLSLARLAVDRALGIEPDNAAALTMRRDLERTGATGRGRRQF